MIVIFHFELCVLQLVNGKNVKVHMHTNKLLDGMYEIIL